MSLKQEVAGLWVAPSVLGPIIITSDTRTRGHRESTAWTRVSACVTGVRAFHKHRVYRIISLYVLGRRRQLPPSAQADIGISPMAVPRANSGYYGSSVGLVSGYALRTPASIRSEC